MFWKMSVVYWYSWHSKSFCLIKVIFKKEKWFFISINCLKCCFAQLGSIIIFCWFNLGLESFKPFLILSPDGKSGIRVAAPPFDLEKKSSIDRGVLTERLISCTSLLQPENLKISRSLTYLKRSVKMRKLNVFTFIKNWFFRTIKILYQKILKIIFSKIWNRSLRNCCLFE